MNHRCAVGLIVSIYKVDPWYGRPSEFLYFATLCFFQYSTNFFLSSSVHFSMSCLFLLLWCAGVGDCVSACVPLSWQPRAKLALSCVVPHHSVLVWECCEGADYN